MTRPYYEIAKFQIKGQNRMVVERHTLAGDSLLEARHTGIVLLNEKFYYKAVDENNNLFVFGLYFVVAENSCFLISGGDNHDEVILGLYHEAVYYQQYLRELRAPMKSLYELIGNDLLNLLIYAPLFNNEYITLSKFPDILSADVDLIFRSIRERHIIIWQIKNHVAFDIDENLHIL